jgi:hypothetical protein
MGKTLITQENLDQFVHGKTLDMDGSKIITAGARDELTKRGIDIVYGEAACAACGHEAHADHGHASHGHAETPSEGDCPEELLIGVAAIIRQHYGITNPDELRRITLETVRAISGQH